MPQAVHLPIPPDCSGLLLSLLERNIHQHLVALNIHHIAECAITLPIEIKPNSAVAHAHIADAEVVKKIRQ